jgi:glutathione S-transferase
MELYGSRTSPFVRRVRAVLLELGLEHALVDTATPEGQAALLAVTPVWKVPVLVEGGEVTLDSRVIVERLLARHGPGPLRAGAPGLAEENLVTVVDAALDAAINVRYLAADGADPERVAYLAKQRTRVASAMAWLEARVDGPWLGGEPRFGRAELALFTALDWMVFRDAHPVAAHPRLAAFRAAHAERPSLAATRPVG